MAGPDPDGRDLAAAKQSRPVSRAILAESRGGRDLGIRRDAMISERRSGPEVRRPRTRVKPVRADLRGGFLGHQPRREAVVLDQRHRPAVSDGDRVRQQRLAMVLLNVADRYGGLSVPLSGCGNMCSHDEPRKPVEPVPARPHDGESHARSGGSGGVAEDRCRGGRRDARHRASGAADVRAGGTEMAGDDLRGTSVSDRPAGRCSGRSRVGRVADPPPGGVRCARGGVPAGGPGGRRTRVHALTAAASARMVGRDKQMRAPAGARNARPGP
jgi:hypothetical protein